jgi:hypothetical protein
MLMMTIINCNLMNEEFKQMAFGWLRYDAYHMQNILSHSTHHHHTTQPFSSSQASQASEPASE